MARILELFGIPSSCGHVLTELSTMIQPSWVALHGMAHSIIELHEHLCHDKAVIHEVEVKAVTGFLFLDSKITVDADCSHEIKRHLLHGRKAMIKLHSILKSKDISLLTKVWIVKAIFPFSSHVQMSDLDHKQG